MNELLEQKKEHIRDFEQKWNQHEKEIVESSEADLEALEQTHGVRRGRADFCQYGTSWRKATAVLTNGNIGYWECRCAGVGGRCSRTGRPHRLLEGKLADGRFLTSIAEVYPRGFVANAALMIDAFVKGARAQNWTRICGQ